MQIKGIKRGKTIELLEELNIPDGQEVLIKIQEIQLMSDEERLKRIQELLENWEGREDFVKTMEELEKEKNAEWERRYGQFS